MDFNGIVKFLKSRGGYPNPNMNLYLERGIKHLEKKGII